MFGLVGHAAEHLFRNATNQANVTFADAFPIGYHLLVLRLSVEVFLPLQSDIFGMMIETGIIYNDVYYAANGYPVPGLDPSNGPTSFIQQQDTIRYLHLYKSIFSKSLVEDYNSLQIMNTTFQEFADQAYEDFNVEAMFYEAEAYFCQKWYDDLMELGHKIYNETNLYDLTTTWLR